MVGETQLCAIKYLQSQVEAQRTGIGLAHQRTVTGLQEARRRTVMGLDVYTPLSNAYV